MVVSMQRNKYDNIWKKCNRLTLGNEIISAAKTDVQQSHYSMVLARFPDFNNENVTFRPGLVVGIYEVEILRDKTLVSHFIAIYPVAEK